MLQYIALACNKMKASLMFVCLIFLFYIPHCAAVTPVRLVDGPHWYAGRLEVYYKGEWGSVCGTHFDEEDADVVCGMIRNTTIGFINATRYSGQYYGRSQGPLMITNLDCNGTEDDIFFCQSNKWKNSQYCAWYDQDVGLDCNTQVRLHNSGYGMGRVEILYNGDWGTVCNSNFGIDEAEVICRSMGLSSRNVSYEGYGYGNGYPTYVMNCYGHEEDISQCNIYSGYCNHNRDVKVECGDTEIRLAKGPNELHGQLQVEYKGRWMDVCPDGFGPNEARVACKMINNGTAVPGTITRSYHSHGNYFYSVNQLKCTGNEDDLSQCLSGTWGYSRCSSSYVVSLDCNTVRLMDSQSSSAGRLEVYSNVTDTWETVCHYNIGSSDATVICRMLGYYSYSGYSRAVRGQYPSGHGDIMTEELHCRGYENDLSECPSYRRNYGCSHSQDVGVQCYSDYSGYFTQSYFAATPTTQTESSLRLVNGNGRSGRVEVYYHGEWGTICDSNFDHNDVQVICRRLGLYRGSSYGVAYYGAHFGEGDGNVVIEGLQCNGYESDLSQCRSKTWLTNGCDHSRDVGVDCYAYRYDQYTTQAYGVVSSGQYEGAIRLVDGYNRHSGRVEVFYNGEWGTVCDDSFDRYDASVVCRVLGMYHGLSYIRVYSSAHFGRGTGPITIDDLECTGNEWGLSQCSSRPWYSNDCGHSEDVGVDCSYYYTTAYPWWLYTTRYYYETTIAPVPSMDDIIYVNCDENGWDIRIDMYRLREIYPDAKASDIYLGENTCTGSQNWNTVTFHQGLRECLTSETVRNNVLVYSNELVYAERDPNYQFIIRHYNWTVGIECDVQRNETSSAHIHHDNHHLTEPQVTGSSHFSVNMSFYSDPNFQREIYGHPLQVSVGDKVYVKVFTTTADWTVKMRVHTCYTKPSQYSPDHMKFFLIRNGCEVDTNTHMITQSAHETKFVFEDFEYTSNHEGLQVFCDAVFCGSYDYSRQCQQTCNPIIRRKVHVEKIDMENTTVENIENGIENSTATDTETDVENTTVTDKEEITTEA